MTVPEKMKLRQKIITAILSDCNSDRDFFQRLLIAQQVVTECMADFYDDFGEVDEE